MSTENNPASPNSPPSLKQKLKSSLRRLPWLCFHRRNHHNHHHHQLLQIAPSASTTPLSALTPSSTWLKSPEFKDKCRNLIDRIGHGAGCHRCSHSQSHGGRRRHSADFRYDPSSYALNFDEGFDDGQNEFPFRSFSARLPASPITNSSTEITN